MSNVTKWLARANAMLGLWLIAASFVFGLTGLARWNAIGVGAVIAILAGYNASRPTPNRGAATINVFAGMYVIGAPSMFPVTWVVVVHDTVVGGSIALFALYNGHTATCNQVISACKRAASSMFEQ